MSIISLNGIEVEVRGMPISKDDFNKGVQSTQLQDFFKQNPNNAYSITELRKQFGNDVLPILQRLTTKKILVKNIVLDPKTKREHLYFILNG